MTCSRCNGTGIYRIGRGVLQFCCQDCEAYEEHERAGTLPPDPEDDEQMKKIGHTYRIDADADGDGCVDLTPELP